MTIMLSNFNYMFFTVVYIDHFLDLMLQFLLNLLSTQPAFQLL
jgi:hypothetical protein